MSEIYQMAGHLIRRLQQISVSVFTEHMRAAGYDLTPVQFAALSAIANTVIRRVLAVCFILYGLALGATALPKGT